MNEKEKQKKKFDEMTQVGSTMPGSFWGCTFLSAAFWQYIEHGDLFVREGEPWYTVYGGGILLVLATAMLFFCNPFSRRGFFRLRHG